MLASRGNETVLAEKQHYILVFEGEWILNNIYENFVFYPVSLVSIAIL